MKAVHETVIKDIVDIFNDIKNSKITDLISNARNNKKSIRSIAQSSSNFTLTYPCLVSDSLDITSASMISKATERKNAQMLQLVLGAYQQQKIEAGKEFDPIEYLQQFHKNLNISYVSTDDIFDTMDMIIKKVHESSGMVVNTTDCIISEAQQIKYLQENSTIDTELPDMFSESSVARFKINNRYGRIDVFNENNGNPERLDRTEWTRTLKDSHPNAGQEDPFDVPTDADIKTQRFYYNKTKEERDAEKHNWEKTDRINKQNSDRVKDANDLIKIINTKQQTAQSRIATQLQNADVKKANELIGTPIMVTVHVVNDQGLLDPVTFLIAIKSKMYPLSSKDIIQRIINKNKDRNFFGKLIKVATGEISFVRDFLLAVDKAKLDSMSQSVKGNSSKLWRVLERMATKSKLSRTFGKQNEYMAITTLVISQEEVEYIKRYANMDMTNENIARGIIDAYNLLCLVIVDETNECAKFLYNADQELFEELSFNQLEREATDGSYKKMVNLITKMK